MNITHGVDFRGHARGMNPGRGAGGSRGSHPSRGSAPSHFSRGQPQPAVGPQPNQVQSPQFASEQAPSVPASTPTGFSQYGTLPSLGASPPAPQRSSASFPPSSREARLAFIDAMCAGGGGDGGPPGPNNLFELVVSAIFAIRNDPVLAETRARRYRERTDGL